LADLFFGIAAADQLQCNVESFSGAVPAVNASSSVEEDMPLSARLIGATSLFLWFGVAYWGRMLPFIGKSI
jgi:hypothetical protein